MIAILNSDVQDELIEMMGEVEFQELLIEAAQKFAERSEALRSYLDAADWTLARSMAHKIKGSMGTLGYQALFQSLDSFEMQLLSVPVQLPTRMELEQIKNVIAQTKLALPSV
jgi:HPt (histidine-containing phosphotransfer) domain-containing protein